jgi:hypothetical protein
MKVLNAFAALLVALLTLLAGYAAALGVAVLVQTGQVQLAEGNVSNVIMLSLVVLTVAAVVAFNATSFSDWTARGLPRTVVLPLLALATAGLGGVRLATASASLGGLGGMPTTLSDSGAQELIRPELWAMAVIIGLMAIVFGWRVDTYGPINRAAKSVLIGAMAFGVSVVVASLLYDAAIQAGLLHPSTRFRAIEPLPWVGLGFAAVISTIVFSNRRDVLAPKSLFGR